MPRNMRNNSSPKKQDDRSGSRSNEGMKSRDNRMDDRETRQGRGSNGSAGSSRKTGNRSSGNKRGH